MANQLYGLTAKQLSRIAGDCTRLERTPRGSQGRGRSRYSPGVGTILMGVVSSTISYDLSKSPSTYPGKFKIWNAVDPHLDNTYAVEDANYTTTEGEGDGDEGGVGNDTDKEYPLAVWPWCFPDQSELTSGHQIVAAYMGGRWYVINADACPSSTAGGGY